MAKPVTLHTTGHTTAGTTNSLTAQTGGDIVIQRVTYSLAGQAIAVRVAGDPDPANNGLFYLHTDHLGSTSAMSDVNGNLVANSTARYTPFGDWRTEPTANLTDRGFTGHMHQNIGSAPDDIGLIYMNARWYSPLLGRFISPDTIVPDPADPQSLNRYSYVSNNPVKYFDPTGHYAVDTLDGEVDPDDIIEAYLESGNEHPLELPIVADNKIVGREYFMPPGSIQDIERSPAFERLGASLGMAGLIFDVGELLLLFTPGSADEHGAAAWDTGITTLSGFLSGGNYFFERPPNTDLPVMLSVNKDFWVTLGDAGISAIADVLFTGAGSLVGPEGAAIGHIAGRFVDAGTTLYSIGYDYNRNVRLCPNTLNTGISVSPDSRGQIIIIHWSQPPH